MRSIIPKIIPQRIKQTDSDMIGKLDITEIENRSMYTCNFRQNSHGSVCGVREDVDVPWYVFAFSPLFGAFFCFLSGMAPMESVTRGAADSAEVKAFHSTLTRKRGNG